MAIIKKFAPFQNLSNYQVFLPDTNPNSSYFRITEFKDTFTGGKNGFLIEGSQYLKESTEVKIEILDVDGNPIYFEPGEGVPEYYEGLSKLVSVHIYNDTPIGLGKITILGELKEYVDSNGVVRPIPNDWKGVYNVKWEKEFKINKNLANEDIVRFYKRPIIQIEELVKPIFSKSVNNVTENVSVSGIPQIPIGGTNLSNWRAGTSYKLIRTTGSWDRDVDENPITISLDNGTTFTPTIIEVLNDIELLVDTPYTSNNLVAGFLSQSAEITYQDFKNEQISKTVLTGSFAKIDMYQLKTFVGDVARVKIFRKSRNQVNDFQLVQETKLESTELLRDITTTTNTQIPYGRFDDTNFTTYWETSSVDHPVSIDSSKLSQAIKIDYSGNGVQKIITKDSFNISKDVEYTLSFKTLLDGVASGDKFINAYFSGSYTNNLGNPASYIQSFMYISGSDIYKTRQNVSQNIISERDISAKLVLEVSGDDWYISNVSLRNAQETSFSPDEFVLIQDIPRKVAVETFDFRFEFYDINNNYIPVEVLATATFDGGNDFPTNAKLLTFESDRNAFRFASGSIGNPSYQQIQFKTTTSNLTGSILFTSQAFDIEGNFISSQSYYESGSAVYGTPFTGSYPGFLNGVTNAGALVSIANFIGSLDTDTTPESNRIRVGSIVYTASLENLQEFETVYRLEDGDNAPALLVTSNANQFIYEPTTLSPKPSGQSITVRAQRKNLASLVTPLEINSSSNAPLTYVDTVNGIDTYTISATEFSSSFASNSFDEVTYSFTGSDVFGNQQSDEITISKVINFDGVSVVLSTENTSFNSDSTGTVTSIEFDKGDGTVDVRVGSNIISHSEGLSSKNTFDIVSVTPSSGLTANSESPTTNSYGISAMGVDSGTLTLLIRYKAGDNSTTVDFTKVVNYSKAKKAQPSITFSATPQAQTIDANSIGTLVGSITDVVISGFEGNTPLYYSQVSTLGAGQYKITNVAGVTVSDTTPSSSTIDITGFSGDTATGTASISYRDSEGTGGTQTIKFTLSKAKRATPVVVASLNPQTQTVDSDASFSSVGIPQNVTLIVNEGGTNYNYGTSGINTFQITNVTGGTHSDTNTFITPTTPTDESGTSGTITYSYINSEGTSFTGKTIDFSVGVLVQGVNGEPGLGAVSIELNPPSQEVVIDIQDNITTPDNFVVQVYDSLGTYSYDANLTSDATFKVGTVTNGSNSNGTITPNYVPDANGLVVSVPIQYRDRDSNESAEIIKTHTIRVVADGSTGPGIVFTGPWDTDRIYQYDISNGRRDAVLYNDVYYATLQQAGTSVGTPNTEPTYWENLGTDSFFVAAEIAIFKESYVQNTLNIGTTSNTISAANITLWGADEYPYFSLGQSASVGTQEYGTNGIFIGRHTTAKNNNATNGSYVLSLVNGTTSWLKWNGSSLDIKGSITITGGNAATTGYVDQAESDAISSAASDATSKANAAEAAAIAVADSIADGTYSGGTYIDGTSIISPIIAGNTGYFSGKVTVGNSNSIVLDATTSTRRIYVGTGTFNNANTGVYLDGGGRFSLKDKLSWDGSTLSITGNITANNLTLGTGVSVPSGNISGLGNLATLDSVSSAQIDTNAVTADKIISSAITEAKLATDAVTSGKIKANAIIAGKIAADAVTADTILAGSIIAGKIAADAVTANTIKAGSIIAGKIAADAVTADTIAANAVTANKILANTINATKISSLSFSGKNATFDTGTVGGWNMSSTRLYNSGVTLSTDDSSNRGLFIDNAQNTEAVAVHDGTSFRNTTSTNSFSPWGDPSNSQSVSGPIFGQNTPTTAGYAFYSAFTGNVSVSGNGMIGITTGEINSLITEGVDGSYWLNRGTSTFVQTYHWLYLQVYNSSNVFIGERLIASGYVNYDGSYDKQFTNLGAASIVLSSGIYKSRIKHLIGINYLAFGDTVTLNDAYYAGSPNAVYATSGAGRATELCQIGLKTTYGINDFTVNTSTGDINLLNVGGSSNFNGPATFTGITSQVADIDSLSVGEISLRGGVLTVNGDIRATGDIYALATSDRRLKTNIIPINNSIEIIKKLNGYTFNWNRESNKSQDKQEIGVIAQEVQEVLPQLVGDKGMGYLGVDYDKIVAVLIEGIKTQQTEIENLREEIQELKKYIK